MSEVVKLVEDRYFAFSPDLDGNELASKPVLGLVALVRKLLGRHGKEAHT